MGRKITTRSTNLAGRICGNRKGLNGSTNFGGNNWGEEEKAGKKESIHAETNSLNHIEILKKLDINSLGRLLMRIDDIYLKILYYCQSSYRRYLM